MDNLPNELLMQIINNASLESLLNLSQTSKVLNDLIEHEYNNRIKREFSQALDYKNDILSFLLYYFLIKEIMDKSIHSDVHPSIVAENIEVGFERIQLAMNTGKVVLVKLFIARLLERFQHISNNPDLLREYTEFYGGISFEETFYNQMAIEILRSSKISVEILDYLKSKYPVLFNPGFIHDMHGNNRGWDTANLTVAEMYSEVGADAYFIPGTVIYEWLKNNSNWTQYM